MEGIKEDQKPDPAHLYREELRKLDERDPQKAKNLRKLRIKLVIGVDLLAGKHVKLNPNMVETLLDMNKKGIDPNNIPNEYYEKAAGEVKDPTKPWRYTDI